MAKSKLATPDWIREGYDSKADYEKAHGVKEKKKKAEQKTFKIRECPKCGSDDVGLVLSNMDSEEESNTGKEWECHKCGWKGKNVVQKELTEDEFMKYLDEKGEEVS
jgi:DNA-directed RNA polymerase subunit M/transcription elongation factor TFIIS